MRQPTERLPPDFAWGLSYGTSHLYVGEVKAVAFVSQRNDGQWYVVLNHHAPVEYALMANCANLEQGKRWIERWAEKRIDRLRSEPSVFGGAAWWGAKSSDDE